MKSQNLWHICRMWCTIFITNISLPDWSYQVETRTFCNLYLSIQLSRASIYGHPLTCFLPLKHRDILWWLFIFFLQNLLFFTLWTNFDSLVFHPSYYIPAHLQFLHLCSPQSLTCGLSSLLYRQVMKEMTHRLTQFELILWQFAIGSLVPILFGHDFLPDSISN